MALGWARFFHYTFGITYHTLWRRALAQAALAVVVQAVPMVAAVVPLQWVAQQARILPLAAAPSPGSTAIPGPERPRGRAGTPSAALPLAWPDENH